MLCWSLKTQKSHQSCRNLHSWFLGTILYQKEWENNSVTADATTSTLQHLKSVFSWFKVVSVEHKPPWEDFFFLAKPHHVRSTIPFPRLTAGLWCLLPAKYLNYWNNLEYLRCSCSINLPRLSDQPVAEHLWHQICRSDRVLFPRARKENTLATTKGEISKVLSSYQL